MAIITVAELKVYLWITDSAQDALLALFVSWANDYIESYCWRSFASSTLTELYDWKAQQDLVLKNFPITSITSISYNTWTLQTPIRTLFDVTTRRANLQTGVVSFYWYVPRGFQNIQVVYIAWYATVPWDLKMAAFKLAWWQYNTRNSDWVTSESVWWDSVSFNTAWVPWEILSTLSKYLNV